MNALLRGILGLVIALGTVDAWALSRSTGTSAWGEEAREVYESLIALGATKVVIPEGPTVIVDAIICRKLESDTGPTANCKFEGDPALNTASGTPALRLVDALLKMGVRGKMESPDALLVSVQAVNCGVLHNVNSIRIFADQQGEASCYFEDQN